MSESREPDQPHRPNPQRPSWDYPKLSIVIVAVASFVFGAIPLVYFDQADLPRWVYVAVWILILFPVILTIGWLLRNVQRELSVVRIRNREYSGIYSELQRYVAEQLALRSQIQRLNLLIASVGRAEQKLEIYDYRMVDGLYIGNELRVTLDEIDVPSLEEGNVLVIIDTEDGAELGWVVVANERSGSNRCTARLSEVEPVMQTAIRKSARDREPLKQRLVARQVVTLPNRTAIDSVASEAKD